MTDPRSRAPIARSLRAHGCGHVAGEDCRSEAPASRQNVNTSSQLGGEDLALGSFAPLGAAIGPSVASGVNAY